jgi:sigma-B regulation protein RsbU (phosphoserine phosphatase)
VSRGEGRHAIVLSDVAGKGMDAALLMAVVQSTFRTAAESDADLETLIARLGRTIHFGAPPDRFVTLFLAEIAEGSSRIRCVNAGHAPLPRIVRASGAVESIMSGGPPLGPAPEFAYPVTEYDLEPGDFICIGSDGITEAESAAGRQLGAERLDELLASLAGRSADEVKGAVFRAVEEHVADAPYGDDRTLVVVRRT